MIAFGSTAELETQLLLAESLGFGDHTFFRSAYSLIEEIRKMLNAVRKKLLGSPSTF
jgi:four helix bundle protein